MPRKKLPKAFQGAIEEIYPLQIDVMSGVVRGGVDGDIAHALSDDAKRKIQKVIVDDMGYVAKTAPEEPPRLETEAEEP